jgi:hypothetical protein
MQTIEADGRPIMTMAVDREDLEFGNLLDKEGPVFGDMMVLAGVAEEAKLTWRDAFDPERDAWTKAAHGAVREDEYGNLDEAREDNFAVWLVPVSDPDMLDDEDA